MMYGVSVFFESVKSDNSESLWEESIFLIDADFEADAEDKAREIAKAQEHTYLNVYNVEVKWLFREIGMICEIRNLPIQHGTELFSRFLRPSEAKCLLKPFDDYH